MLLKRSAAPLMMALALGGLSIAVTAQDQKESPADVRDFAGYRTFTKAPFHVAVSDTGRISRIESPIGTYHNGASEYQLCTGSGNYEGSSGFYLIPGGLHQPNGDGKLPLSITVRTHDNNWQINWTYAVNPTDVELLVTAAVKRLVNPAYNAWLELGTDFDVNYHYSGTNSLNNYYDISLETAWQRNNFASQAWALLAQTRILSRYVYVSHFSSIYADSTCHPSYAGPTPGGPSDVASGVTYYVGNLGSGSTKTVKFQYNRH